MSDKQLAEELAQCQLIDVEEEVVEEIPLADILESRADLMEKMVKAIINGDEKKAKKLFHEKLKQELREKVPPSFDMVTK